MRTKSSVTFVEIAMAFVVFLIVAVVALPSIGPSKSLPPAPEKMEVSSRLVLSAYAYAIALHGDFPKLSDIVEFVDADFASETNQSNGIIFRDKGEHLTVKTFQDTNCKVRTNNNHPGKSDIVRCI